MIGWLTLLPLRAKLIGIAVAGVLATIGYLWLRWRIAASRAASATAKADALEAARKAEIRIAERRAELRERHRLIREQIEASKIRDGLDGQGWGP
jgi:hypothetical protein